MRNYLARGRLVYRYFLVIALVVGGCIDDLPPRTCSKDTDCLQSGARGSCLSSPISGTSYCVFPAAICPGSPGAWGVLAGDGLARSCYVGPVPADAPIVVDV